MKRPPGQLPVKRPPKFVQEVVDAPTAVKPMLPSVSKDTYDTQRKASTLPTTRKLPPGYSRQ